MLRKLTIFDFDDTLISSNANITITHSDGSVEVLTSHEYAKYREKPGDAFDFSEFDEYPKNATLINDTFKEFRNSIRLAGDVVILTARSSTKPVEDFLSDQGFGQVEVVGVGSSDPMDKARYVLNRLKTDNYDLVHVYEDNFRNIRAIKKVVTDEGVKFQSTKVAAGRIIETSELNKKELINHAMMTLLKSPRRRIMSEAKDPGAGIVVVKNFNGIWKVLGLMIEGEYDFPKGKLDPGESYIQAAIRETSEEASITDLNFKWGMTTLAVNHLIMYVAETSQDGSIKQNPETGIYEHESAHWLTFEEASGRFKAYLEPALIWAKGMIES